MNHAISGEILAKESRFPQSEIFFATLPPSVAGIAAADNPETQITSLLSGIVGVSRFLILFSEPSKGNKEEKRSQAWNQKDSEA